MNTLRSLSTMPTAENVKIVDGALDNLIRNGVQLKSRTKRPYKLRRAKKMATSNTAVVEDSAKTVETVQPPNYTVGVPQEVEPNTPEIDLVPTEYGFRIRGDGDHKVVKKIFDLDTLEKKQKYNVFTVKNVTEKSELAAMDSARLLALVNLGLQKESLMQAKKAIGESANAKAVNDFVNNFRFLPQFAKLAAEEKAPAEIKSAKRKEQTQAIMSFIHTIPGLFEDLKEAAKQKPVKVEGAPETSEDEDDNDEE
jgi:hypothetical protein